MWNDSGVHSRQPPQPAEVDLDSLLALNMALTPPRSEPAEEHRDLLELRDAIRLGQAGALYWTRRSSRRPTPDEANQANPSLRTDSAGGHKRLFAKVRHHIKDAISERDSG
jgi:hypothetical protein